jgi:hypothetical protein
MKQFKTKFCKCGCNTSFEPTGPRQLLIPGHKIKLNLQTESNPVVHPPILAQQPKPRHEFEEYEDKDTKGKKFDSVCLRAWMAAGNIALIELGMDGIEIEKNGLVHSVRKLTSKK